MKNIKLLYVWFLFGFLFTACNQTQVKSEVHQSKYCTNQMSLFSVPDSLKKITIDYQLEAKPLLKSIEEKLDTNVCGELVGFGLILENEDVVKVKYRKMCDDGMISCYLGRKEANVILNLKGLLLIEHEIVPMDSVKFWMRKNFLKKKVIKYKRTSVLWDVETPKDSIEKAFAAIRDGYLLVYENLAQELFSKKICELKTSEIDTLKKRLPFTVELDLKRTILLPPPPPPIETTEEEE
ncbi:hypothetical protein [uncultured Kordia sp.]|uniref:hypothetical protein n=1 Tax=uncultured Kordia sp. TaxID=507699 RepID=UPI00262F68DD|nr:hypothetical protein [uncultured Kordia sp.]